MIKNNSKVKSFLFSRGFKYTSSSLVSIISFISILIIIQVITFNKKIQKDITLSQNFTLSEQSQKILKNLKDKIELIAFIKKGDIKTKDLLEQYKAQSSNLSYELYDPSFNPSKAKQYDIRDLNTIVVSNGLKQEKINIISEDKITNALIKVTREGQKKIYFVKGHGEKNINDFNRDGLSALREELVKQNYQVEELLLLQKKEIPSDSSVIIFPGVKTPLMKEEEVLIDSYLKKGGRIILLTDPDYSKNINPSIKKYNVSFRDDLIVDKLSRAFGGDFLVPMITQYGNSDMVKELRSASFLPLTSSIDTSLSGTNNIFVESLAYTTQDSWGEKNKSLLKQNKAKYDPEDTLGPLTVATYSKILSNDKKDKNSKERFGYLTLFGDSDFIINSNLMVSGNSDLILNIINWSAQQEDLISIRPKENKSNPLLLTETQGNTLFIVNVILLPFSLVLIGSFILIRRRIKTQWVA